MLFARALDRLLRPLTGQVSTAGAGRRLGRCPGCGSSVFAEDRHVRYRGEVFHAEPCVEISPYAVAVLRDQRSR